MFSITIMPCGPPNPRNAVCEVLLVFEIRPCTSMFGIQYALSMWQRARPCTGSDRSRLQPPSAVSVAVNAWIVPSSAKPAFHSAWKPCRLPEMVMSWVRLNRTRTGRPVTTVPSAAMAAYPCGCISLPPKPPPMRRHCTVTSWYGLPSTCETMSCVSVGCCVEDWTKICPFSSMLASAALVSR